MTLVSGTVTFDDGSADSIDVATYGTDYIIFRAGSYFTGEHELHFQMTGEHTTPPAGTEVRMMAVGYNSASGLPQERDVDIVFVASIPVGEAEASVVVTDFGRSVRSVVIGICLVENVAQGPLYGSQQHKYFKYEYEYGVYTPASANVAWDGTVLVLGDRTVLSSRSLTIGPGTEVRMWPEDLSGGGSDVSRIELNVNGHLIVNCTTQNPVVFRSWDGTGKGDWLGIKITDDTGNSRLEHVVIKNAEAGVTFFEWPYHQALISDLRVENCRIGVRNVDPEASFGGISATGCDIGFSTLGGLVEFEDIAATGCGRGFHHSANTASVTGATFVDCDTAVVAWGNLTLRGSEIRNSQLYGVWARGGDFRMAHTTVKDKTGPPTPVAVKIDSTVATAVIDTCRILGAGVGVETKAQTTLTGCDISDCYTGLSAPLYPLSLIGSRVAGELVAVSLKSGLLFGDTLSSLWTGLSPEGPVTCRESVFMDCGLRGIYASGAAADVTLRGCTVSGSDVGAYFGAESTGDIDSACVFTGNDTAIEVYGTEDVTVRRSTFEENTTSGIYLHSALATIEGNTIRGSANGMFFYESEGAIQGSNVIEENGSGVKCDEGSAPVIRANKIVSNGVGIAALNEADPDVGWCCGGGVCDTTGGCSTEGWNNISGNTSHHIVNLSPSVTIMAECNYWGSRGPLPSKFSGAVDYNPYLGSNPLPDLVAGGPQGPSAPPGGEPPPDVMSEVPMVFDLSQNYPNPFNPTTTMRYQVPRPGGPVSVVIYDVRGVAVRTLVSETKAPGFYTLTWDGKNDGGMGVATGVYFVRMSAPGFVKTEKLIIVK